MFINTHTRIVHSLIRPTADGFHFTVLLFLGKVHLHLPSIKIFRSLTELHKRYGFDLRSLLFFVTLHLCVFVSLDFPFPKRSLLIEGSLILFFRYYSLDTKGRPRLPWRGGKGSFHVVFLFYRSVTKTRFSCIRERGF